MGDFCNLEISLHRYLEDDYIVDFRFTQPESDAEIRLSQGQPVTVHFNLAALEKLKLSPDRYGQVLTDALFAAPQVQSAFAQARASAGSLGAALRVRLLVGPGAPELHGLYWETLRDPADHSPLCTQPNLFFSRYLSSPDWQPVKPRAFGNLRALVVIASPSDLADYNLAPVDTVGELERARTALGNISLDALPDQTQRATLNNLNACLRGQSYDILYLVCHGRFIDRDHVLYLEDDAGKTTPTGGSDLAQALKDLPDRPRLVALVSCESAGLGSEALSGLGPRLAEVGIPAVLAMQGRVSLETAARVLPAFFKELQKEQVEGQVDGALAAARAAVRDRPDAWMPVLFMRLQSGRIWYRPGFRDPKVEFERWPVLLSYVENQKCTPILGHGLLEPLLGSLQEMARRWAEAYRYPMARYEMDSLPDVAQFLSTNLDPLFPYQDLATSLRKQVQSRWNAVLPETMRQGRVPLTGLLDTLGSQARQSNPVDPHRVLASLPLPLYITTTMDNLMESALVEAGKKPQPLICPWNDYIEESQASFNQSNDIIPTSESPMVYHLFGRYDDPRTMVLTEDDYFEFLRGVTGNKDLIPLAVRQALADSTLLFLGFQVDDWDFRVLLRGILPRQVDPRRIKSYGHIAAQIEPLEGRALEPERARRYLEKYFSQDANLSMYWGSVADFMKEFQRRWDEGK